MLFHEFVCILSNNTIKVPFAHFSSLLSIYSVRYCFTKHETKHNGFSADNALTSVTLFNAVHTKTVIQVDITILIINCKPHTECTDNNSYYD